MEDQRREMAHLLQSVTILLTSTAGNGYWYTVQIYMEIC